MRFVRLVIVSLVVLGGVSSAGGQVVQLPTFQSFSVGTTVVVPDRGAAYLGGVNRAYYQSNRYGVPGLSGLPGVGRLFGNRSAASGVSSSGAYVTATIIDHREWDAAVLAAAQARSPASRVSETQRRAAFIARHIVRSGSSVKRGTPLRLSALPNARSTSPEARPPRD
jgi:type II secretory pathway component GspD/PulD (secretin)